MIVVLHDAEGRIGQILLEPIPADYLETLRESGQSFIVQGEVGEEESDTLAIFAGCFVSDGELAARPDFPASIDKTDIRADSADKATIIGLPQPCTLMADGQPVERKGGTLTLTSNMPADYEISADVWPYLPWRVTVRAR